ncbi:hypothetical protein D3C76_1040290 [compost metagenome]
MKLTGQRQGATGEKLAVGLTIQPGVRVRNDVATFTQQERVTGAAEIQGVDGIGHGGQADVTTEYPERLTRVADPGHRRDQDFAGGGVLVGFGQDRLAACFTRRVPRAGATVIVGFWIPG